jgi:Phage tail assembly chaperone protein, TAC
MFGESAARLAGMAGALLGWRPHEFWDATPAELTAIINALSPPEAGGADGTTLTRLQELFPDG